MDKDDNIYIYNFRYNFIKKYNIQGKLLTSFGGRGFGPGELTGVDNLYIEDDTLKVYMGDQKKFNFYSLNGEYIKSFNFTEMVSNLPNWFTGDDFKIYEYTYSPMKNGKLLRFINAFNQTYWGEELSIVSYNNSSDKIIIKENKKKLYNDK